MWMQFLHANYTPEQRVHIYLKLLVAALVYGGKYIKVFRDTAVWAQTGAAVMTIWIKSNFKL